MAARRREIFFNLADDRLFTSKTADNSINPYRRR